MELKPGYKQTEVGVIPEDWRVVTLSNIADVRDGTHDSPKYVKDGVPFVTSKNILHGRIDFSDITFISNKDAKEVDKRSKVDKGDILISMIGTVGNAALVDFEPCFSIKNVGLIKPYTGAMDSHFLIQYLHSNNFKKYLDNRLDGGIQKFVSLGMLRTLSIPSPPTTTEQGAIAATLSDVDALLNGLDRLIAKKRDLKQAAMQQLLTGEIRLPGFEGEWEEKRLGDHVIFLRNGVNSRAELTLDDPVKYLHYGDIHSCTSVMLDPASLPSLPTGKAKTLERLRDGDLVFADASEDLVGVSKSVEISNLGDAELVAGLHTIAARFDKAVLADGFKAYLQFCPVFSRQLRRLAAGTKVYATNRSHIASVEMRLPGIKEQKAIAATFNDMDAEITALEQRRAKTKDIKQAMMQELLTGRIRLLPTTSQ